MQIKHWMMFGTFAEQRHFVYPTKDTYQGVVINGNMAAHAPDGLAAFLLEKTNNLPYIIDPITHAFQHDVNAVKTRDKDPSKRKIKSSIEKIANYYGEPIKSIVGNRPIRPPDFKDNSILTSFVKNCLKFQKDIISTSMENNESIKYILPTKINLLPYALIAPYFYMTETSIDKWIEINLEAVNIANSSNNNLFAFILIDKGILTNSDMLNKVIDKYKRTDVKGYIIWIDDFNETEATSSQLKGYRDLVNGLKKDNIEILNLHGSYFSLLLASNLNDFSLSGVCHGPEYGEYRSVIPVGGGIPIARYYIPELHSRIRYREVLEILSSKEWLNNHSVFYNKVCSCDECKETIKADISNFTLFGITESKQRGDSSVFIDYPTTEASIHCLQHYLHIKKKEFEFASIATKEELINNLNSGINNYIDIIGDDGIKHLILWKRVFEN